MDATAFVTWTFLVQKARLGIGHWTAWLKVGSRLVFRNPGTVWDGEGHYEQEDAVGTSVRKNPV